MKLKFSEKQINSSSSHFIPDQIEGIFYSFGCPLLQTGVFVRDWRGPIAHLPANFP